MLVLAVASGCRATAYHVDHGLRAGSSGEAAVVAEAAERLRAGFVSLRVEVAPGPNLEARAREARFAVLPSGAATGHTADDQAETVLVNLLRGAGPSGLAGMRPGARHPILGLRRSETRALVVSLGLSVVEDPTNSDPRHQRNRIRHELLPLAGEVARRDLVPVLARQAALIADDADLLEQLARSVDPGDARALVTAPAPLARRAVRRWVRELSGTGYPPDAAAVDRVLAVARGEVLACELPGGLRIRRSKGRLLASAPDPPSGAPGRPGDGSEPDGGHAVRSRR